MQDQQGYHQQANSFFQVVQLTSHVLQNSIYNQDSGRKYGIQLYFSQFFSPTNSDFIVVKIKVLQTLLPNMQLIP